MVDIFLEIKYSTGKAAQLCDRKMGLYCIFLAKYGQLGLEGTNYVAFVCEANHVIVGVAVFISVDTQSQAFMVSLLWGKMSHDHAFAVSRGNEGGDKEEHGASLIL